MTEVEPPTYYANVVTVSVDPDVVYIELRRFIRPHIDIYHAGKSPTPDVVTEEAMYAQAPLARVVLTYTAGKALLNHLADLLPKMEVARKANQPQ